jgi:GNAT superfamily N-acetyltransferase
VGAQEFAAMERFFHSRGARVAIDLCPLADPGLLEGLRRRSYRPVEFNNTMVRLLGNAAPPEQDCRVRPASCHEVDVWASTVARGFFECGSLAEEELEVGRAIFHMGRAECWLAQTDGQPAGGGALAIRDGVGLLFADSVIPARRRQGLHAALIRARIARAIAAGCELASASTQPGSTSQRNYERQGFQVAYTKVLLAEE